MDIMEWIITSCILLALISVIRQVFKEKLPAKVRYGMWLIVLVRLLLPVSLTGSSASVLNLFSGGAENMRTQSGSQGLSPVNLNQDGGERQGLGAAGSLIQGENGFGPDSPDFAPKPGTGSGADGIGKKILAGIWIAGMAVCGLALLGSNLIFMRKLRRSRKLVPPREIRALENGGAVAGHIPVYISKLVGTPCLFGLFRPAIYIRPENQSGERELSYILRHEYTHYRHLDHVWAFCRVLCLMVHWYNPLVWAGAYWNRQDGEIACDAGVLAGMGDAERLEYGRLLIELAKKSTPYGDILCCATTMSGGKKNLKERVRRAAQHPKLFLVPTAIALSLCLAVSWVTFTAATEKNSGAGQEKESGADGEGQEKESGTDGENQGKESGADGEGQEKESGTGGEGQKTGAENGGFEGAEKLVNAMFADVTHDGVEDAVLTTVKFFSEEEANQSVEELLRSFSTATMVRVYDGKTFFGNYAADRESWERLALEGAMTDGIPYPSDGEAIWERELGNPHVGNGLVFLTWRDGEAYMLESSAWIGQGIGDFSYQVFSLDSAGAVHEKDSGQAGFGTSNFLGEKWEDIFPIPDMLAYTGQIAPWIEESAVVAVMEVGYEPLVSRPGQSYALEPWEIWKGFLGDIPAGMEDLEEKLKQILQELIAEE